MLNPEDIKKTKEIVEKFFQKMTIEARIDLKIETLQTNAAGPEVTEAGDSQIREVLEVNIKIEDPQILIGERGQTLLEIQRLLRTVLNKKLGKIFYLNLDINDYKKKKIEYLKDLARDLADEVALTKEEKVLLPMPPYERRIIHLELSVRPDVITESEGEEPYRKVIIKPRSEK